MTCVLGLDLRLKRCQGINALLPINRPSTATTLRISTWRSASKWIKLTSRLRPRAGRNFAQAGDYCIKIRTWSRRISFQRISHCKDMPRRRTAATANNPGAGI